jgi:hypothetical protein
VVSARTGTGGPNPFTHHLNQRRWFYRFITAGPVCLIRVCLQSCSRVWDLCVCVLYCRAVCVFITAGFYRLYWKTRDSELGWGRGRVECGRILRAEVTKTSTHLSRRGGVRRVGGRGLGAAGIREEGEGDKNRARMGEGEAPVSMKSTSQHILPSTC